VAGTMIMSENPSLQGFLKQALKYFKAFDELRASVLGVFRNYLDDVTKVIRVMKKLRTVA
jgi:hypothetical protein